MPDIHATALVDSSARLDDDVKIGAYCIVEADVHLGAGTRLNPHAMVRQYTILGKNNLVDSFAVLGGLPQDLKFDPRSVSYLRIGDDNVFRENVTISRATGEGLATEVGNHTFWMAGAHAGHNVSVGDDAILVNGCALGGHSTLGRGAILSAHVAVHQFCRIGELVMSQGNAAVSAHVPPFVMFGDGVNNVIGLNRIGLRRSPSLTENDRREIEEAFRLTYRAGLPLGKALAEMEACREWGSAADRFRQFVRQAIEALPPYKRPLCQMRRKRSTMD